MWQLCEKTNAPVLTNFSVEESTAKVMGGYYMQSLTTTNADTNY
jgi:hypothetical protein